MNSKFIFSMKKLTTSINRKEGWGVSLPIFQFWQYLSPVLVCLDWYHFVSENKTKEIGIRKVLGASFADCSINTHKRYYHVGTIS